MKRTWPCLLALTIFMPISFASLASAPETIDGRLSTGEYAGGVSLIGDEILIVDGGDADVIDTWNSSQLKVQSTSLPLSLTGRRGVYDIHLSDNSSLLFTGGATESVVLYKNSIAEFKGGQINHITIYRRPQDTCYVTIFAQADYQMNATGISGLWEDGSPFDIHFDNASSPFPPTANFVNVVEVMPEPGTLALLGLGGLLLRRKR
jgi:hypothetical protein